MGEGATLEVTILPTPVQWMRSCERCDSEQIFCAGWECKFGLIGYFIGCGHEELVPFTRTPSGVRI